MCRSEESSLYTEPMGITHDERQAGGFEADSLWEQHYSEGLFDCDTLSNILELCTSQFMLLELLRKTATGMLWKYIPFMFPSQSLSSSDTQSGQDWEQHEARLKNTLLSCGFARVKVLGNGDSLTQLLWACLIRVHLLNTLKLRI